MLADRVQNASLVIRDGSIHRIGPRIEDTFPSPGHRVDCEGDYLLPGLVELHTDNLERHLHPRPGTWWSAASALWSHDAELAAAGITTACDAITLGSDAGNEDAERAFDEIMAGAEARSESLLRVDHQLHFRCELSSPSMAPQLAHAYALLGVPRLVSLMDHTPGQGQWTNMERFRRHYSGRYGLGLPELDALVARRQRSREQFAVANRVAARDFAHRHRCILASHDDTTEASIRQAFDDECTLAEFPTSLEAARAARTRGMTVVAGAPNLVRGGSHSGNVAAADLIAEGLCDMLSSDYYPASLLQSAFMLARRFGRPLHEAVASVSATPARALGLYDRGDIREGLRADLVRVRETSHGPIIVSVWCGGRQVA